MNPQEGARLTRAILAQRGDADAPSFFCALAFVAAALIVKDQIPVDVAIAQMSRTIRNAARPEVIDGMLDMELPS